jgi:indolepyruvate decarboxylase
MVTQPHTTVGAYLVRRLEQLGLRHIFGVPGDYALTFFDILEESGIELINTCNELNAGYAADGYARMSGIGAVCLTYGVGGFSVYNAVAGAYAERSPLVVISGGPKTALRSRLHPNLLHHTIGDMNLQRDIFERITQDAVVLLSPTQAVRQIDELLAACVRYSRPVYIEIPADMATEGCETPGPWTPDASLHVDEDVLEEALGETCEAIARASHPVILAGVEVDRMKAREALLAYAAGGGFPTATTPLGKGIIPEETPNYLGVYMGALANETARRAVEESDLLLCLGAWMTDLDLGGYTARLDPNRMIVANSEKVKVRHHIYEHIPIKNFLDGLLSLLPRGGFRFSVAAPPPGAHAKSYVPSPETKLTTDRFWRRVNHFLKDDHVVVVDTGSASFESIKLCLPRGADYLSQAFYASMGFGTPAALGVKFAAPGRRPIVFVGDGAFQMTGQELSSIVRYGQNPVIFLINNDGYQVERAICDNAYNDLMMWDYARFPEIFGAGRGACVSTEGDLESALALAEGRKDSLVFVEVRLDKLDFSETLKRIGKQLR